MNAFEVVLTFGGCVIVAKSTVDSDFVKGRTNGFRLENDSKFVKGGILEFKVVKLGLVFVWEEELYWTARLQVFQVAPIRS